jgi:hypothetical protein
MTYLIEFALSFTLLLEHNRGHDFDRIVAHSGDAE